MVLTQKLNDRLDSEYELKLLKKKYKELLESGKDDSRIGSQVNTKIKIKDLRIEELESELREVRDRLGDC